jgi:2'-5' RNA ligase
LTLDRIGAFHRQGIAWAGASSPPAALAQLAAELSDGLVAGGFRLERRPFRAHVTLARRCRIRAGDPMRDGEPVSAPVVWNVARMTLVASELASGPPQYRELDGWPLPAQSLRS